MAAYSFSSTTYGKHRRILLLQPNGSIKNVSIIFWIWILCFFQLPDCYFKCNNILVNNAVVNVAEMSQHKKISSREYTNNE